MEEIMDCHARNVCPRTYHPLNKEPTKGVWQECILSPILFNIYSKAVLREALQEWNVGVVVGGGMINNLRFVDDTTLFTKSEPEMGQLIKRVEEESNKYGLTINRNKTKITVIDRARDYLTPMY